VLVLTRPQVGLADAAAKIATAKAEALPAGPTAWPVSEEPPSEAAVTTAEGLGERQETTTSGEEG